MTERQEVPKELKNTGQQLTTSLEDIQDLQTPQNVKKQLSRLVEQVTDTLQVISDPKTPPKERAALTKVVRQVTDTLQVISDPKTPPKERAALTKIVQQVSDMLQVISDPQTSPKERAKAKKTLKQLNKQLTKHLKELHEHPKADEPDMGHPKADEPDMGHPKADEPDMGHPKTDEPDMGHPKTDEPDMGHPKTDEPDKGTEPQTQSDCEKANRPWVETESGGFCGQFGTITGPQEDPAPVEPTTADAIATGIKVIGQLVDSGNEICRVVPCTNTWSASDASRAITAISRVKTVTGLAALPGLSLKLGDALEHYNTVTAKHRRDTKAPEVRQAAIDLIQATRALHQALLDVFPVLGPILPVPNFTPPPE